MNQIAKKYTVTLVDVPMFLLLLRKSDPVMEKFWNTVLKQFMQTLIHVFVPSFVKISDGEVTQSAWYTEQKTKYYNTKQQQLSFYITANMLQLSRKW